MRMLKKIKELALANVSGCAICALELLLATLWVGSQSLNTLCLPNSNYPPLILSYIESI